MATPAPCIAFFDFDGTLAKGDSLWPFLIAVAGWPRCLCAVAVSLWAYAACPPEADQRTIIKDVLLRRILGGRRVKDLDDAIARMKDWPRWLPTVAALKDHHARGHHIVIATGSLGLYVPAMLGDLPYHAILATEIEVVDDVLTGRMSLGNCVRQTKAERVAAYMKEHGPFAESWAYGNAPHDLPMMQHVTHGIVV